MTLKNLLPTVEILFSAAVISYLGRFVDEALGMAFLSAEVWVWVGIGCIVLGILIRLWSSAAFTRHHVTVLQLAAPQTLVQEGPFAYSRNPLFVGIFLIALGMSLVFQSLSAVIVSFVLLGFAQWWLIYREEPSLLAAFGDDYRAYMQRVRRWM